MRKIHFLFLSLLSGILLSLPWLLQETGWILFVAFIPLLLAESYYTKPGESFTGPYAAFFLWNLWSTWWIAYVSLPGMLFIVAENALLMALAWWAGNRVRRVFGPLSGYFSLIVFWISFEFLSHRGMLPWPWLTLGNGFANSVQLIQWYEFTGVLGGSLWIIVANIFTFELIRNFSSTGMKPKARQIVLLFVIIAVPSAFSYYLYQTYQEKGVTRHVVILQPNIDPYTEKFSGMSEQEQIRRLAALTEQSISGSTDLVLAPETALPAIWEDSLLQGNGDLTELGKIIGQYPKVNFISGAITKKRNLGHESLQEKDAYDSFNSAVLINDPENLQFSHKTILVAGVEKAPFRGYFDFLPGFLLDPGGSTGELTPGEGPTPLKLKSGELAGPVICFESVFGNFVREQVLNGSGYLVVLTNDGWWKRSIGVWQHFEYSRIRAVETRRSIARSANTGISACINQRGDVLVQTEIARDCAISCSICSNDQLTLYVRYGDYIGRICLYLSVAIILYWLFHEVRAKKSPH